MNTDTLETRNPRSSLMGAWAVLFRLKASFEHSVLDLWELHVRGLTRVIPGILLLGGPRTMNSQGRAPTLHIGLRYVDVGRPLLATAHYSKGS